MTSDEFRDLALEQPQAVESAHQGHPDFRVRGKIFATLGYPDDSAGMVKLTPEQQKQFMRSDRKSFAPCAGAWGARGATIVYLKDADADTVRRTLRLAWLNVAPKQLAAQFKLDD